MEIDPVYLAASKLRKRQFDACIEICTRLLEENPLDQVGCGGRCGCTAGPNLLIVAFSNAAGCLVPEMPRAHGEVVD